MRGVPGLFLPLPKPFDQYGGYISGVQIVGAVIPLLGAYIYGPVGGDIRMKVCHRRRELLEMKMIPRLTG